MATVAAVSRQRSKTKSLAFVGLTVAIMVVSAWVTIPIGPVPITLQIFAVAFAIMLLSPREAIAAVYCYELLGAIGLPVFSGMRGGIGVLFGPTGGFLLGYLIGVPVAVAIIHFARKRGVAKFPLEMAAGLVYLAISYLFGWLQFMVVMNVGPEAAFLTSIAPFIVIDILKIVIAISCATAIRRALPQNL